jgi:excisionase family DNA binding protein
VSLPLLTTEEVAERLRVDVKTVRALVEAERLRVVRLGKRCLRFDPRDVEECRTRNAPLMPLRGLSGCLPEVFGAVYFVRSSDFIKIGFTATPLAVRLKFLQTGNPHKLEVVHHVRNVERTFEKVLHAQFDHLRHREEWFIADETTAHPVKATTISIAKFAHELSQDEAGVLAAWGIEWGRGS